MNLHDFGVEHVQCGTRVISKPVRHRLEEFKRIMKFSDNLSIEEQVLLQNEIKKALHEISPFKNEPVDCVQWIKNDVVTANDYNPNSVAPTEMKLLELSINEDGYTQPIVSWGRDDVFEVVDGFHRHRVGKESDIINTRIHGYLPIVVINGDRTDKGDRMAATIRHNRARGKHKIDAMSDIVLELKKRNWKDTKIAKHLGMEPDEVLRLCQISGLAEMFADREFSEAWEADSDYDSAGLIEDEENISSVL